MADKKHRISCVTLYPAVAVVALVSAAVSAAFIARSAFEVDGRIYFSLFDDAMISMRYGRNLAEGHGLVWNPGPAVIVASSGMLAGGPSLSYARSLAPKPENAILLTGYQDEESPGRRLQELGDQGGKGTIRLGADKIDVQCHLAT